MTAERELAGFVLPFTIGLGLTAVLQTVYSSTSHFFASASLSCILICMYTLLQSKHNKLSDSALWITVIILGLCSGVLIQEAAILHFSPIRTDRIRILKAASDFGEKMKSTIASIPFESSQTNAIATALITGDRGDIRPDVLEFFRKSGASHILALSGMHLGIIYGLLKIILAGLGNTPAARRIKACFSIFICGFYALSTGAGPSITRAFIFILIAEIASITQRRSNIRHTLYSALLIQLILTPEEITDVGFQLSYAAIAGIAYIYPWLYGLWPQKNDKEGWTAKGLRWIWNSCSLSVACQVTTAPIAYYHFGTFPKYFLITNMLAIPLVGLVIPFTLITLILSSWGICPDFIRCITEWLIDTMTYCLGVIASLQTDS